MNIKLCKKNNFLVPAFDADYEKVKKLKHGEVYSCSVSLIRNAEKNALYHKIIDIAWDCLDENQEEFFGKRGKNAFRKSLEITAGFFEPVYDLQTGEFIKAPLSTSFDAMEQHEFDELFNGVLDVLRMVFTRKIMSDDEFDAIFGTFYGNDTENS